MIFTTRRHTAAGGVSPATGTKRLVTSPAIFWFRLTQLSLKNFFVQRLILDLSTTFVFASHPAFLVEREAGQPHDPALHVALLANLPGNPPALIKE